MRKKWIFIVPLAILGISLVIFIGGEIVKELWNWLTPALFGLPQVTFWQAAGLLALCRILFGGSGMRTFHGPRRSPEERERFRQAIRKRWGAGGNREVADPAEPS